MATSALKLANHPMPPSDRKQDLPCIRYMIDPSARAIHGIGAGAVATLPFVLLGIV